MTAALHRLRAAAAPRAGIARRRHRRDRLRGRRGHGAPAVGAARREAAPAERATPASSATPYCIAAGFVARARRARRVHRGAGARGAAPRARGEGALRDRPEESVPDEFTGHIRARLRDGTEVEERQPHMRGGAHEPISRAELEAKFRLTLRVRRLAARARRTASPSRRGRSTARSTSRRTGDSDGRTRRPRRARHRRRPQHRPRDRARARGRRRRGGGQWRRSDPQAEDDGRRGGSRRRRAGAPHASPT